MDFYLTCASFRMRRRASPGSDTAPTGEKQRNRASSYQIHYKRSDMGKGGGTFERLLGTFNFYTFLVFTQIDSAMFR